MNTYLVLADGTVRDLGPVQQPAEGKTPPPPPKYFGCKPFVQEEPPTDEQIAAAVESISNPVPAEITSWRAKAVLTLAGLLPAVEAAIAAMPEPQKTVVQTAWTAGAALARNGATVTTIAPVLGLTDAQIDTMFRQAAALEV